MFAGAWAMWGQLLLLTAVLSLDAWAAGVAYGLRRIRVPLPSLMLMSAICGAVFGGANQIGALLAWTLGVSAGHWLGGTFLIGRGIWMGLQPRPEAEAGTDPRSRSTPPEPAGHTASAAAGRPAPRPWLRLEMKLRSIGLVVQVLRYPDVADLDRSGGIGGWEAILMGLALALDSVGVGIAATGFGQAWWVGPAVVTMGAALALSIGGWWGGRLAGRWWGRTVTIEARGGGAAELAAELGAEPADEPARWLVLAQQWLPAVVLIGLGLARLFT